MGEKKKVIEKTKTNAGAIDAALGKVKLAQGPVAAVPPKPKKLAKKEREAKEKKAKDQAREKNPVAKKISEIIKGAEKALASQKEKKGEKTKKKSAANQKTKKAA